MFPIRLKFFPKLLVLMLILSILPVGMIWYTNYKEASTQIETAIEKNMSGLSDRLTQQVNDFVEMHLKLLRQNAALSDIVSMDEKRHNPILKTILNEYKWSYLVFATGMDGINMSRTDELPPSKFDYNDRYYFNDVAKGGKPFGMEAIVSKSTKKPSLVLSVPIVAYKNNGQKTVGVLAIGVSREQMSNQIGDVKVGETGFAFMFDAVGRVVAHQNREFVTTTADFSKHPAYLQRPETGKKFISYDDSGRTVAAFVQKAEHGWYLVVQQDYSELYGPRDAANKKALAILGVTAVIVSICVWLFAFGVTHPIRQLTAVALRMSRAERVERIPATDRGDELGDLAKAIDRLGTSASMAMARMKGAGDPHDNKVLSMRK